MEKTGKETDVKNKPVEVPRETQIEIMKFFVKTSVPRIINKRAVADETEA